MIFPSLAVVDPDLHLQGYWAGKLVRSAQVVYQKFQAGWFLILPYHLHHHLIYADDLAWSDLQSYICKLLSNQFQLMTVDLAELLLLKQF